MWGSRWRDAQSIGEERPLLVVFPDVVEAVGSNAGNASAVPSQQGLGGHDPAVPQPTGERGGDCSKKRSIVILDGWPVNQAAEHLELVAKHDDLEVLGASRTHSETGKCSDQTVEEAKHDTPGWSHRGWSTRTRDFPSPTGIAVALAVWWCPLGGDD